MAWTARPLSRTVEGCERRDYGFDANSNRTSLTSFVRAGDSNCGAGSQQSSVVSSFTASDQMLSSSDGAAGLSYDDLGRVTTLPAGVSPVQVSAMLDYYANNLVHSISNTATNLTDTYSVDTAQRVACVRTAASGSSDSSTCAATTTNTDVTSHYLDESSDSPSWTITKTGTGSTTTFNATDLTGGLVATISGTSITQHVADIRGNITLTTTTGLANATITSYDEYGNTNTDPKTRPANAWHGQQQRTTNNTTGLIQMGVRLYNSITGLFLQQDPVHGGNPNTYTHPVDPINKMDLTGEFGWEEVKLGLGLLSLVGCGVCGAVLLADALITAVSDISKRDFSAAASILIQQAFLVGTGRVLRGLARESRLAFERTSAKLAASGKSRTLSASKNHLRKRGLAKTLHLRRVDMHLKVTSDYAFRGVDGAFAFSGYRSSSERH